VYTQAAVIVALACQKGRDGKIVLLYDLECCMLYPISGLGSENSKSVDGSKSVHVQCTFFSCMYTDARLFSLARAAEREAP
jgi:hypothetical protein